MHEVQSAATGWQTHPWVVERRGAVRFGIAFGPQWQGVYTPPVPRAPWLAFVQEIEALGFDSYWLMDHPALAADCWTQLAACAVVTNRLQLGTLVSCVFYRSPALLARVALDIDQLSDGRTVLGIGTGDYDVEFAQLGMSLPTGRERREALDETLQIVMGAWSETPVTVEGRHFKVEGFRLNERSLRQPRVPILIAGGGEQVTLQRVARYADMSNFGAHPWAGSAFGLDDIRRKWEALRRHCDALGRPYDSVLRSHVALPVVIRPTAAEAQAAYQATPERLQTFFATSALVGSTEEIVARYRTLRDAGFQYFIAGLYGADRETARLLAEQVAPAVAG